MKNYKKENIITGLWKFSDKISEEELINVAHDMLENPKYLKLYIRKVSKDQTGIGFMYDDTDNGTEESYDKFFDENSDKLKRQFGNGFVGWDLASNTIIIK